MKKIAIIGSISALAFSFGVGMSHADKIKESTVAVAAKVQSGGVLGYGKW